MYEIRKVGEDLYQLHCAQRHERSVEGTLLAVITYATHIGFNIDELELAFVDLIGEKNRSLFFGNKKYSHSVVSYKKYKRAS